jgi:hypothetical protein
MENLYKEVKLLASEFEKANALDDSELKKIRSEYFKGTFVYSLIVIMIGIAVAVYMIFWGYTISVTLLIPAALCIALVPFGILRCIMSFIIVSKIDKRDFFWHTGSIRGTELLRPTKGAGRRQRRFYYLIDDKYNSYIAFSPLYKKGTSVYYLYFPVFSERNYIGGVVVRKKA